MTPTQLVHIRGYAFLPAFQPTLNASAAAAALGAPEQVDGLRLVQELVPTERSFTTPNTYSGNFGLADFPLHTDLAHWARPPRYLMLRCFFGDPDIDTRVIDGLSLIESIGSSSLARCLARPRRPMNGALQLLPIWQRATETHGDLFRWDSVYLQPTNEYAQGVFSQIAGWLSITQPKTHVLEHAGDTLLLDNWRVLHGRSDVSSSTSSRQIHRLYLSSLK